MNTNIEELKKSIRVLNKDSDDMYKEIAKNQETVIGMLRAIYDAKYRLKPGDVVAQAGKLYQVKDIIVRAGDDPDGKPGVCGYSQRATGVFGTTVRNLYNDWEIVSQA